LAYLPLAVIFVSLSAWLLDSWIYAFQLSGGVLIAILTGLLVIKAVFRLLFRVVKNRDGLVRLIVTQLARSRFGMNFILMTLILVALVLNLIPHLLKSVVEEISPLQGREVPALFLFNIPESDVDRLQMAAQKRSVEIRHLSPMIVARLTKLNGEPIRIEQFQRFPVRLSYRDKRIPSEEIIEGREFLGRYGEGASQSEPEISVERRWAERNGFQLGDRLEFDVQDVPVTAKITSVRAVKWTEFNPNFFIIFQPGVLDDAPKTYLANINIGGHDKAREQAKIDFQYMLAREFPDMNIIDIGRTLDRTLVVIRSVLGPVQAAAWIAVSMSFLILMGVIFHNLRLRRRELDIYKVLGADRILILKLITFEYLIAAFACATLGSGAALILNWMTTSRILEIPVRVDMQALGMSYVVILTVTTWIAYASCRQTMSLRGAAQKL
jgi:putative ABC transport system permease protein